MAIHSPTVWCYLLERVIFSLVPVVCHAAVRLSLPLYTDMCGDSLGPLLHQLAPPSHRHHSLWYTAPVENPLLLYVLHLDHPLLTFGCMDKLKYTRNVRELIGITTNFCMNFLQVHKILLAKTCKNHLLTLWQLTNTQNVSWFCSIMKYYGEYETDVSFNSLVCCQCIGIIFLSFYNQSRWKTALAKYCADLWRVSIVCDENGVISFTHCELSLRMMTRSMWMYESYTNGIDRLDIRASLTGIWGFHQFMFGVWE